MQRPVVLGRTRDSHFPTSARITDIADHILVSIGLIRVGNESTVIVGVGNTIAVAVHVALVPQSVLINVFLPHVGGIGAVINSIFNSIAIAVAIARIAPAIAVEITKCKIWVQGAGVFLIGDTVPVG